MLRAALLAALMLVLAPAVARADKTRVYFTKGEQLAYVQRDLPEDFGPEPFTEPKPPTRKTAAPAKPRDVQAKLADFSYLPAHGCARLPLPEAKIVYDFVSIGTPVQVI